MSSCMLLVHADSPSLESAIHVRSEAELREAVNNAPSAPMIIALDGPIQLTETPITIPAGKDITLVSNSYDEFFPLFGAYGQDTIAVANLGILQLKGIIVTHTSTALGRGVTVNVGGTLVLFDGVISGNTFAGNGGGVYSSGRFSMYGGVISGNTLTGNSRAGGGVFNNGGTFELFDGVISGNTASGVYCVGGGVYNSNGVFTMSGGIISGNRGGSSGGGGVYSTGASSSFSLFGGVISGNTASGGGDGGVVHLSGVFKMFGGVISGNTVSGSGGGVHVGGGTFELFGGVISNNTASNSNGGGVYVTGANTVFVMSKGEVSSNRASSGGGVYVASGRFELSSGLISSNIASGTAATSGGGGVYNAAGNFTLVGGMISDNRAANGGGVYIGDVLVRLLGGVISDNTAFTDGGGVWIAPGNLYRLFVSEDVVFSGNHAAAAYDRHPDYDAVYRTNIGSVAWTNPLIQGYNNYDISHTLGDVRHSHPIIVRDSYSDSTGTGNYLDDEYVTVNAGIRDGFVFSGWAINEGNVTLPNTSRVTFRMPNDSVDITATWKPVDELMGIEVTELPLKLVYIKGELLDLTGLIVTATYNDGSTKTGIAYTTSPVDGSVLNVVGLQNITVNYVEGGISKTVSFLVTVNSTHEHVYSLVVTEPTCTEQGYTTHTCDCDDSYTDDYKAALGHDFSVLVDHENATCVVDGYDLFKCVRCDVTQTVVIPALGHDWDEGVVTIEPTIDSDGLMTFSCLRCGELRTEVIDRVKTGDALLSELSVDFGTLSPKFASDTFEYFVAIENNIDHIVIVAVANDARAVVSGDVGEQILGVGVNNFVVNVTAANGTKSAYTINVTRAEPMLTGIEITAHPSKLAYAVGEVLDLSGLVVTAVYSDDSTLRVENYTTIPAAGAVLNETGTWNVTVSYSEGDVTVPDVMFAVNVTGDIIEAYDAAYADFSSYYDPVSGEFRRDLFAKYTAESVLEAETIMNSAYDVHIYLLTLYGRLDDGRFMKGDNATVIEVATRVLTQAIVNMNAVLKPMEVPQLFVEAYNVSSLIRVWLSCPVEVVNVVAVLDGVAVEFDGVLLSGARTWVPGVGYIDAYSYIDVAKTTDWKLMVLTFMVNGQPLEYTLVNDWYVPPAELVNPPTNL
ncbi:MAG: bacterial Ig-like domain-containing protein [Nitrososphaerota archaeon]|nr:bacterial Ig-like domain-containing protein [Nitrososphaerota archaeon]